MTSRKTNPSTRTRIATPINERRPCPSIPQVNEGSPDNDSARVAALHGVNRAAPVRDCKVTVI